MNEAEEIKGDEAMGGIKKWWWGRNSGMTWDLVGGSSCRAAPHRVFWTLRGNLGLCRMFMLVICVCQNEKLGVKNKMHYGYLGLISETICPRYELLRHSLWISNAWRHVIHKLACQHIFRPAPLGLHHSSPHAPNFSTQTQLIHILSPIFWPACPLI